MSVLIPDVDDVPVVCLLPGTTDATILCDDVATPEDKRRLRDGARGIEGALEPVPLLLDGVGVTAILVGVEVVHIDDVRTDVLITGATWRGACTYGDELGTTTSEKIRVGPLSDSYLLAVELAYARIGLEVYFERREESPCGVDGSRGEDDELLLTGEREVHDDKHGYC